MKSNNIDTNNFKDSFLVALFNFGESARNVMGDKWCRCLTGLVPNVWLRPKALGGRQLLLNPVDWSQTLIFNEIFLHQVYDLDRLKFEPDIVIDCGAHIGMFSLLASTKFPRARIVAFEPNPRNAKYVRRQIQKNHLVMTLFESAVSLNAGTHEFGGETSHNGRLRKIGPGNSKYKVTTTDFPAMLKELRVNSMLLKMDIEGEEESLIPAIASLLPEKCVIFFETHYGNWEPVRDALAANGFSVTETRVNGSCTDGMAERV